jgi:hypothetical protein
MKKTVNCQLSIVHLRAEGQGRGEKKNGSVGWIAKNVVPLPP